MASLEQPPIRVFLLDDHEVVRRGVRDLLEASDDIVVVGEAATAEEAVGRILATSPHVAVLDVRLPDGDGISVCRQVRARRPDLRVLMLTSLEDDDAMFDAIEAGASGYLLKQVRSADLVESVRLVAAGQSLLDPAMTGAVLRRLRAADAVTTDVELSDQEERILELVTRGLTNREIGAQLALSEKTIKNHVSQLLRKLGVRCRTEAAVFAARRNEKRTPSYAVRR